MAQLEKKVVTLIDLTEYECKSFMQLINEADSEVQKRHAGAPQIMLARLRSNYNYIRGLFKRDNNASTPYIVGKQKMQVFGWPGILAKYSEYFSPTPNKDQTVIAPNYDMNEQNRLAFILVWAYLHGLINDTSMIPNLDWSFLFSLKLFQRLNKLKVPFKNILNETFSTAVIHYLEHDVQNLKIHASQHELVRTLLSMPNMGKYTLSYRIKLRIEMPLSAADLEHVGAISETLLFIQNWKQANLKKPGQKVSTYLVQVADSMRKFIHNKIDVATSQDINTAQYYQMLDHLNFILTGKRANTDIR